MSQDTGPRPSVTRHPCAQALGDGVGVAWSNVLVPDTSRSESLFCCRYERLAGHEFGNDLHMPRTARPVPDDIHGQGPEGVTGLHTVNAVLGHRGYVEIQERAIDAADHRGVSRDPHALGLQEAEGGQRVFSQRHQVARRLGRNSQE